MATPLDPLRVYAQARAERMVHVHACDLHGRILARGWLIDARCLDAARDVARRFPSVATILIGPPPAVDAWEWRR